MHVYVRICMYMYDYVCICMTMYVYVGTYMYTYGVHVCLHTYCCMGVSTPLPLFLFPFLSFYLFHPSFPSNPPLPSPPLPSPPLPQPQQVQQALCYRRAAFEQLVGGILHKTQTWFHGNLSREESETLLRRSGLKDGTFLVRERVDANSYAICVAHSQKIYHYLLERNNDGLLSIQKGRKFENLLQVR